jgi:hypothetical protein
MGRHQAIEQIVANALPLIFGNRGGRGCAGDERRAQRPKTLADNGECDNRGKDEEPDRPTG